MVPTIPMVETVRAPITVLALKSEILAGLPAAQPHSTVAPRRVDVAEMLSKNAHPPYRSRLRWASLPPSPAKQRSKDRNSTPAVTEEVSYVV
jgi:hypothetical protein